MWPGTLVGVPQVIVDVVLKPEISDPQGQAVLGALGRELLQPPAHRGQLPRSHAFMAAREPRPGKT